MKARRTGGAKRQEAFEGMLMHALGKLGKMGKMGEAKAARAILASQKGRPTLFKGMGRPGLAHVADEFGVGWPGGILGEVLSVNEQELLRRGLAPWAERQKWLHPAWSVFGAMPYPSCHDAHIARWELGEFGLLVELDGYFSDGTDPGMGRLAFFFEQPRSRALWRGEPVATPGVGVWDRKMDPKKPFLAPLRRARGSLSMGGLPWVHMEELSLAEEGDPAIRLCLGGSRQVELEISGACAEVAWGAEAMMAMGERRGLARDLARELPVGESAKSAKGARSGWI